MMINDQETQYFNSEKYGEITYFIEKTDDVPQPYHLSFWGTRLDGYQLREVKLEIIQELRKNLGIRKKKGCVAKRTRPHRCITLLETL